MIWIYRWGYWVVWVLFWMAAPFSAKLRQGFSLRRGLLKRWKLATQAWDSSKDRIWFHVSSAGELEQVYPLLERFKKLFPQSYLALTFFSPSALQALHQEEKRRESLNLSCPWDAADFSPWDFSGSQREFLTILKPKACLLIHREIWPEMLFQNHEQQIPTYLLAGFFPQNRSEIVIEHLGMKFIKGVIAADPESLETLKTNYPDKLLCALGDPRSERVLQRKERFSKTSPWKMFFDQRKSFIGASLWEEDFQALQDALPELIKQTPNLCCIWVPHEPTPKRIQDWQEKLKAQGISTRKWSHWLQAPDLSSHLIVDGVGFLAELYQISDWVFVGGSFKGKIHNVLEPLAYGAVLFSGPFISNSPEAKELSALGLLQVASSSEELSRLLKTQLSHTGITEDLKTKRLAFLESRRGVSEKYVAQLSEWIGL